MQKWDKLENRGCVNSNGPLLFMMKAYLKIEKKHIIRFHLQLLLKLFQICRDYILLVKYTIYLVNKKNLKIILTIKKDELDANEKTKSPVFNVLPQDRTL